MWRYICYDIRLASIYDQPELLRTYSNPVSKKDREKEDRDTGGLREKEQDGEKKEKRYRE